MNFYLLAAAGMTAFTSLLHIFGGGQTVAKPLLRSQMRDVPKFTNYYCWHIVSILLIAMAGGFYVGAVDPSQWALTLLLTILATAFTVWSLVLVIWKKQTLIVLPQWVLFFSIAVLGSVGIWLH